MYNLDNLVTIHDLLRIYVYLTYYDLLTFYDVYTQLFDKKFFIRNFGKMNFKFKKFGLQFSQN